jgi:diguanylate cyclase (GGDEF)-like protein/PAS domain S-box-containing protein
VLDDYVTIPKVSHRVIPVRVMLIAHRADEPGIETLLLDGGYEPYIVTAHDALEFEHTLQSSIWDLAILVDSSASLPREGLARRLDEAQLPLIEVDSTFKPVGVHGHDGDLSTVVAHVLNDVRNEWTRRQSDIALTESGDQVRALFEFAAIGLNIGDSRGRCITSNPAFQRMLGYTEAELRGMRFSELTWPEDRPRDVEMYRRLRDGEIESYQLEKRYLRKDGGPLWTRTTISLVPGSDGQPRFDIAMIEDISGARATSDALHVAEDELRRGLLLLRAVTEATADAIFLKNVDGEYLLINSPGASMLGRTPGQVIGQTDFDLFGAHSAAGIRASDLRVAETGLPASVEETRQVGETVVRFMTTKTPLYNDRGEIAGVVGISKDMTARREAEERLAQSEARYRTLIETSLDGIVTLDTAGAITFANRQMAVMLGCGSGDEIVGASFGRFVPKSDQPRAIEAFAQVFEVGAQVDLQFDLIRVDESSFPAEINASIVHPLEGERTEVTVVTRDITERKAHQDQLRFQALHDALTGLPNRTLFSDRLGQALLHARRDGDLLGVLLLDVDRFKEVNDTLGHHLGDTVLQQVSRRFVDALRESDTVARLGGDEFAMVLPDVTVEGAIEAARKLREALATPLHLNGRDYYVAASIGIVVCPDHGDDATTLLKRADVAMYSAKRAATGYAVYSAELDPNSQTRLSISSGLRHAIDQDQLVLHYQPKIHFDKSCADHVEALVRWNHPEHGLISPDQFIPMAEQSGLIGPLTRWVVREAVRQTRAWRDNGLDIEVAVNLSAFNLQDPEIAATIGEALREYRIAPEQLLVEITESALMSEPLRAHGAVTALHALGVHVAIDDFGTGYSSLAYLHRLHVDEIKIDKSFVLGWTEGDESSAIIVRSVIDLGHNLGLQVVAEGVETEAVFQRLRALGCDLAQGYHVARPMSSDDFTRWWREWDVTYPKAGA